jgi:iron complex transport system permease protein
MSAALGPGWLVVRVPGTSLSARWSVRSVLVTLLAASLAGAVFVWSLTFGTPHISAAEVLRLLAGGGDPTLRPVLFRYRLARGIGGLCVGGALGVAGLVFQRVTRNPLATPDLIGISGGATCAAAFMIVIVGTTGPPVTAAAIAGGFAAAIAIHLLAAGRGGSSGYRLVLIGVGVTFITGAVTAYLVSQARLSRAQRTITLLVGSLAEFGWDDVRVLGWTLAVAVPAILLAARSLRVLELGDDAAVGLGVARGRVRIGLLGAAVALASVAAATCGPIAFVALLAPQIARSLVRDRTAAVLPSAAIGALLVVVADLLAREVFSRELPAGVFTAVLGAPFLLALLWRTNRSGALG